MAVPLALFSIACAPELTQYSGETDLGVGLPPPPPPPPAPPPPAPPPPAPIARVNVQADRITITEKIQFDAAKATIKAESNSLLDEIAAAIKAHPELKKIRVEGHASSDGDAKQNLKLSDDRAKSVVAALVTRGVDKGVLTGKGFGSKQPIASNDTEDGREKNRRVDFVIVDPAPPKTAAPATPAAPKTTAKAPKTAKTTTTKGAKP